MALILENPANADPDVGVLRPRIVNEQAFADWNNKWPLRTPSTPFAKNHVSGQRQRQGTCIVGRIPPFAPSSSASPALASTLSELEKSWSSKGFKFPRKALNSDAARYLDAFVQICERKQEKDLKVATSLIVKACPGSFGNEKDPKLAELINSACRALEAARPAVLKAGPNLSLDSASMMAYCRRRPEWMHVFEPLISRSVRRTEDKAELRRLITKCGAYLQSLGPSAPDRFQPLTDGFTPDVETKERPHSAE
ncbi:hypothetical protein CF319_g4486 [Tilletia indica]|uniref:Uncharacterized protein n=1 Tax=Tilletia indica TaxID=43049 RepID=A0A177T2G1_9BASI|nr:hypothetical protein CF319_g4486 [Tilletia indica]KAE8238466.1 hypothetical protein A4X13_0g8497 [Tilletia indica]